MMNQTPIPTDPPKIPEFLQRIVEAVAPKLGGLAIDVFLRHYAQISGADTELDYYSEAR